MASDDWRVTTLGEVIELKRGYDLPKRDRRPGPYPIVSSSGISGSHIEAKVQAPGVVTGRYGTIGQVFHIVEDFWPLNTALYVRDFKGNDVRFISYLLQTLDFSAYSDKAAVPGVNRNHLHMASVRVPGIKEQQAIAHILGTLDDKIELNRRMNETLESMAQAIFKSWFVDFDPVRAKSSGRQPPGLARHIADVFPDAFDESELGEIPKGWRVGVFGEVAENPRRGVSPSELDPGTPYIALEHMPRRRIALDQWGIADDVASGKFRFRKGDILFGKLRPYFHKVGVAPLNGVCSTDILVVSPRSQAWFGFVMGHVSSVEFVNHTDATSTGTKMPRTNWSDMSRYDLVIPSEPVMGTFSRIIHPVIERIIANTHETRTLAALRDTLLPKLISGELRVPDAERIVGRCA
jgi:type I restriction enzyme, S subunit